MNKKQKLIALIPALWACLFDITITILHQSENYWRGDLSKANEGNPIGSFFMRHHTSGIFIISLLWIILVVTLGYYLPRKISRVFLLFTLLAHSYGASTWLSSRYGFWYTMVFILFNSFLFYIAEDRLSKQPV